MYRQTPPEYHALVVENERDIRNELIYTIESLDLGITVVDEASDYDSAVELLDEQLVDLLITDINLLDAPRFEVGVRDGTALALYAREKHGIPTLFLTAFADYDPEVAIRAAASDPVGFIQKQGDGIEAETRALMTLALRRLERLRREHEHAEQLAKIVRHVGEVLIYLDEDGRVLDFNLRAAELLGLEPEDLIDQHWDDILPLDRRHPDADTLASLINRPDGGSYLITTLRRAEGTPIVARVTALETEHHRQWCTLLLIKRQEREEASGDSALPLGAVVAPLPGDASGNSVATTPLATAAVSPARTTEAARPERYNPYRDFPDQKLLQRAGQLMRLATPVALIGEPGMETVELARLIATRDDEAAEPVQLIDGKDFSHADRIGAMLDNLARHGGGALILRDPHWLHSDAQALIADALLRQSIDYQGVVISVSLPRLIAILPTPPARLASSGDLHPRLASALGASLLAVPPLRDLGEGLLPWATALLAEACRTLGVSVATLSEAAEQAVRDHPWPGNLRELRDRLQRAAQRAGSTEAISPVHLGLTILEPVAAPDQPDAAAPLAFLDAVPPGLRRALADALDLAQRLPQPPRLGNWCEDEIVVVALERFKGDSAPLERCGEFLGLSLPELRYLRRRSGLTAGARHDAIHWQQARLELRNWVAQCAHFEGGMRDQLRLLLVTVLRECAPALPAELAALLAGCSPRDYLSALRKLG